MDLVVTNLHLMVVIMAALMAMAVIMISATMHITIG